MPIAYIDNHKLLCCRSPGGGKVTSKDKKKDSGKEIPIWLRVPLILLAIYLFILSIKLMGGGFKMMGSDFSDGLIQTTDNPFVGLFIGILATAIVQSSSMTTSIVVVMVGSGTLPVYLGIPIVLGANVGTSVTATLVSLTHVTRPKEFKKAFSAAIVHDNFNIMVVMLLFPLEVLTRWIFGIGYLEFTASLMSDSLASTGGFELLDPMDIIVDPILDPIKDQLKTIVVGDFVLGGLIAAIVGFIGLIIAMRIISTNAKKLSEGKAQALLTKYVFKITAVAFLFGLIITLIVQSSSVTTSLCIPFVAGDILTIEQVFPYMLGANIGTTITAVLAALVADDSQAALTLALTHSLFNVTGCIIFLPFKFMRKIPIEFSKRVGEKAAEKKRWAALYIIIIFFLLPIFVIVLWRVLNMIM